MEEDVSAPQHCCPFCSIDPATVVAENELAVAIHDGFPVSPGHLLIIPKRHVASFFEVTEEERGALFALVARAREILVREHRPDGFNVGINDGAAAGQTVMHLHIHLIPRYSGDTRDPRGGVRWIMPEMAPYWKQGPGTGD